VRIAELCHTTTLPASQHPADLLVQTRTSPPGTPVALDGRRRERLKRGASPQADAIVQALRAALDHADRLGTTRKAVAARLGVQLATLENWITPGRRAMIPAEYVLRTLTPGTLPEPARMQALAALGRLVGVATTPLVIAEPDRQALPVQACEISAAVGRLAQAVAEATHRGGDGGRRVTAIERAILLAAVDRASRELEQLRAAVKGGAR
jgi:hypothetical protein